ncbi:MAG: transcription repressor NadR [Oscillospiraceae bacterium]
MNNRKNEILKQLSATPITANILADLFGVSRQVIVGDIAILRASGNDIISTPKGYMLNEKIENDNNYYTITCNHSMENLENELYTIIDNGGIIIDVLIEHGVYGQIQCPLYLRSRFDCDQFIEKIGQENAKPLCSLTNGVHMHTISCPNDECYGRIAENLRKLKILID